PLIFALIFSIIVVTIAFALVGARDMGAGYLPAREGRESAKKSLLSVRGLLIKLNKGTVISWLVAFVIIGAVYGSIYGDMQTFLESIAMLRPVVSQFGASIE